MPANLSRTVRKKDDIITRQVAGETLLVPISGDLANMQRIFSLDRVAEYIWQQLDGKRNLQEIRDSVLDIFEVERRQAEVDISEFIDELLEAGLVTRKE